MIAPVPLLLAALLGAAVGYLLGAAIDRLAGNVSDASTRAAVAAVTAAVFAFVWWSGGPAILLVSRLTLGCALIVLFVVDLYRHRLPNVVTLPGIVVGFVLSWFGPPGWRLSLLGIVVAGGTLWMVGAILYRIRGHERLGMGDAKMLAMIGAFVGLPLALVALVLAMVLGTLTSIGLLVLRGRAAPAVLPFGPFLAVGAAVAATAGPRLLEWYTARL